MTAQSLDWYLRRLRRMGPGEIAWRAGVVVKQREWARRRVLAGRPDGLPDGTAGQRQFTTLLPGTARDLVPGEAAESLVRCAERLLDGHWEVFGSPRPDILDPDWFLDTGTGVRAPSQTLAFSVRHRDETEVGNVKALWEVSRHHHLTVLAAAWWLTGDDRYAKTAADQLRSWWDANPFLTGVHWTSGIEVALRLISWTWVRRFLADWTEVGDLFDHNPQALWQLWWHQSYLAAFPSRGSSANNHVVAEASGLLVASCAFPWYSESEHWRGQAGQLLAAELEHNTFPSGVNRELASDYHRFVTELGLVAMVEAASAGHPPRATTWDLLSRSLDAAAALLDVAGNPPRQGDGDEGRALLVDDPESNPWTLLLGLGEQVLGRAPWWPSSAPGVEAVVVGSLLVAPLPVVHRPERPDSFVDAGLTLLRSPRGTTPELWCRCDGGPHGFLAIAAHAHADALSVELRVDGVEVLVDPGTYCYHGEPEWRTYFRSTLAHNTLELAGADQSEPGGPFLWTRHAATRAVPVRTTLPGVLQWSAEHDGYRRLSTPARHRRKVQLDLEASELSVTDTVEASGSVAVRLAWHLGPDVSVVGAGDTRTLSWEGPDGSVQGELQLPPQLSWSAHRGETQPVLGWYSPGFGRKVPTTTLVGTGAAVQGLVLVTRLAVQARPTAAQAG